MSIFSAWTLLLLLIVTYKNIICLFTLFQFWHWKHTFLFFNKFWWKLYNSSFTTRFYIFLSNINRRLSQYHLVQNELRLFFDKSMTASATFTQLAIFMPLITQTLITQTKCKLLSSISYKISSKLYWCLTYWFSQLFELT